MPETLSAQAERRVCDVVDDALRRHPTRVAFEHGQVHVTYAELRGMVGRAARALQAAGVRPGDGVGLLSANRPEVFAATMAVQAIGARFTPLHPLGSIDDHAWVCGDAELAAVLVDRTTYGEHAEKLRSTLAREVIWFGLGDGSESDVVAGDAVIAPPRDGDATDIALVVYTGGTTGRPKGVVLSHRALVTNLWSSLVEWDWPTEVRLLAVTPLSHALGLIVPPVFLQGGTVVLLSHFEPELFLDTVETARPTVAFAVPTMVYLVLDALAARPRDTSSLEVLFYGAAPMAPARLLQGLELLGPVFVQIYGQTEAPNTISSLGRADHDPDRPHLLASCGRPHLGIEVAIHDHGGKPLLDGQIGEVCVRGPLLMDGYWKQPELTTEALRDGWLRTGDVGKLDHEGFLYLVDRSKDMIITGGFNVYPREVEDVLTTHPAVRLAGVIGLPDDKWGEAVHALVVLRPGAQLQAEDLIALVKERKGSVYAPKSIEFVETLPLTLVGKIDKKALRERYWDGESRAIH